MHSLFGLFVALFAGFWLLMAGRGMVRMLKEAERSKWVIGAMSLLILIGAGGFFAAGLSALGVLRTPSSYEWPAGYVKDVVVAADGKYIVPLIPSGRVQIYDAQWHFIRGWHVDAEGGDFRVESSPSATVEVFTARGEHHYSFSEDGHLISAGILPGSYSSVPNGQSIVVPTSPLLWVFSSPFLSWGVALIGFVGIAIMKKISHKPQGSALGIGTTSREVR